MEYELDLEELEKTNKLKPKHEAFCYEYVSCLIACEAYKRVYPNVKDSTARSESSKLLTNPNIQARIRELQEERAKRYNITPDFLVEKALQVYSMAAKGKKEVKLDIDGNPVDTGEITYDFRAMNDALKNIGAFTGINAQTIKARLDAKAEINANVTTADDIAEKILGDN